MQKTKDQLEEELKRALDAKCHGERKMEQLRREMSALESSAQQYSAKLERDCARLLAVLESMEIKAPSLEYAHYLAGAEP